VISVRKGFYAVVAGVEYEAKLNRGAVSIFIPQMGDRPDGWEWAGPERWYRVVEVADVSEAYEILTDAMLDDVPVHVDRVDPVARTAVVRAKTPPYSSMSDQHRPPPHPLLEAVQDPPYSVDWMGIVPWDCLADVDEAVGRIDPATGEDLPDQAP
jgi:hypothetical protein